MPTPAAHREPGERIVVIAVPRDRIPLGAGVREASVYRDPERLLGIELVATPAPRDRSGRRRSRRDHAADVVRVARDLARVQLAPEVEETILASRVVVDAAVNGDRLIYGLNTGLGAHARPPRAARRPAALPAPDDRCARERHRPAARTRRTCAPRCSARISGAARGGAGLTLEARAVARRDAQCAGPSHRAARRLGGRGRSHAHGRDRRRHDRASATPRSEARSCPAASRWRRRG